MPFVTSANEQEVRYPKGAELFQTNCVVCHQAKGVGLVGLAPPLLRNPGLFMTVPEGRDHLALMVLNGMFGEIKVDGNTFNFKMPSFDGLSNEDLAVVINYVAFDLAKSPESSKPLTAQDIAAARKKTMTSEQVREHRSAILKLLGI
jgi:mono/diheme cytochrome c family protein